MEESSIFLVLVQMINLIMFEEWTYCIVFEAQVQNFSSVDTVEEWILCSTCALANLLLVHQHLQIQEPEILISIFEQILKQLGNFFSFYLVLEQWLQHCADESSCCLLIQIVIKWFTLVIISNTYWTFSHPNSRTICIPRIRKLIC